MPKHRTIVWILALGAMACSAPKAERLRDDPASSKAWTQKSVHTPAVADAINRFNQAILSEQLHIAYALLSRATRRALEERARPHGLRGVDLLASGQKDSINPIETFTAPNIQKIQVPSAPSPASKPHDGRLLIWKVGLVSSGGKTRSVALRFEGIEWRIHNPQLKAM